VITAGRLLFRYGSGGCYYAGIGGFGAHFAIGKYARIGHGEFSQAIGLAGQAADVRHDEPYSVRIEFIGNQVTVRSFGVILLQATDSWLQEGYIGFETWGQTRVEFSNFRAYEVPPITDVIRILESFPYTLKRDYSYHKRNSRMRPMFNAFCGPFCGHTLLTWLMKKY